MHRDLKQASDPCRMRPMEHSIRGAPISFFNLFQYFQQLPQGVVRTISDETKEINLKTVCLKIFLNCNLGEEKLARLMQLPKVELHRSMENFVANQGILDNRAIATENRKISTHLSLFRRLAVNHAHPTKLVLDIIGFSWMSYFIWENNLITAIIFGFGLSALGSFLTLNADTDQLATTALGKYVVARLHPANLTFQIVGYVISMYGLWVHQGWTILMGLSAVTLGHLWGWGRKVVP